MMTRKHLVGLAEALGTRLVAAGLPAAVAVETGAAVARDLLAAGLVTRAFDAGRFATAVEEAAEAAEMRRTRLAA